MCTILHQAFQLVYTEATMEHLTESINAGEKGTRGSVLVPAPISPIRKQMMDGGNDRHRIYCSIIGPGVSKLTFAYTFPLILVSNCKTIAN